MGIGRTREESWTEAAPCAGHVSMRRAHAIMLRPPMHRGAKVIATTDRAPLSPTIPPPSFDLAQFEFRGEFFLSLGASSIEKRNMFFSVDENYYFHFIFHIFFDEEMVS